MLEVRVKLTTKSFTPDAGYYTDELYVKSGRCHGEIILEVGDGKEIKVNSDELIRAIQYAGKLPT